VLVTKKKRFITLGPGPNHCRYYVSSVMMATNGSTKEEFVLGGGYYDDVRSGWLILSLFVRLLEKTCCPEKMISECLWYIDLQLKISRFNIQRKGL
jgi:hypothetical protein